MTRITPFHLAVDAMYDKDQTLWGAYRAVRALIANTENEAILSFLRAELDEFLEDVVRRYDRVAADK